MVSEVEELRDTFDRGDYIVKESIRDVHTVAAVLKLWLRNLREPLIPANF